MRPAALFVLGVAGGGAAGQVPAGTLPALDLTGSAGEIGKADRG